MTATEPPDESDEREAQRGASDGHVTVNDLRRFADTFADLGDPDVMRRAWE